MASLSRKGDGETTGAIQKAEAPAPANLAPVTATELQEVIAQQQQQVSAGEAQANEAAKLTVMAFNRQMDLNKPVVLSAMADIATQKLGEMADIWSGAMTQANDGMVANATPVDLTGIAN